MALILRGSKNFPLTNTELDANFTYLEDRINLKLNTAELNPASVNANILSGPQGAASGIDSSLLRGYAPTNLNQNNTIVQRDSSGAFSASSITANTFNGKATDSVHADTADAAVTLSQTLPVANGGTGAITAAAARINLAAVGIAGDSMSGKLTLVSTSSVTASLNIPYGNAPSSPVSGDFWATSSNLFYRVGTLNKAIAYTDSNITGTAANVSGIVSIVNGGTGSNVASDARTNLSAAKSGANSDITSLSGLTTALTTAQGGTHVSVSGPEGNILTSNGTRWISKNPELFQIFSNGISSPNPTTFASTKVQGFDAYSSTDFPGNYYVGITVTGVGSRSAQLGMCWDSEENKPSGLAYRTNDDSSDVSKWSDWSTIWNERNLPVSVNSDSNTVPIRDGSGNIKSAYIIQTSYSSENPVISQVMVTNSSDNTVRKASISYFTSSLSGTAPINISGTSVNVSGIVSIVNGGTGANSAINARTNLSAAKSGANSDITSLSGLTTPLSAAQGGTGVTYPGTSGNVLVSNGSGWESKNIGYPVPAGAIMPFYRSESPDGWLECNGQTVNSTSYPNLAAAMGVSGNFTLPDLRGEFIRGLDRSRGVDPGRTLGSSQEGSLQTHTHDVNDLYGLRDDAGPAVYDRYGNRLMNFDNAGNDGDNDSGNPSWFYNKTLATGGSETRPRNIAFLYCIKY